MISFPISLKDSRKDKINPKKVWQKMARKGHQITCGNRIIKNQVTTTPQKVTSNQETKPLNIEN